ncbi:MAG: RidA family protein [Burkholderiales bacterium]|nr:MAG: RidA family protein [Burkholderiales bacterium]
MTEIVRKRVSQRMSQIVCHNGTVYLAGQVGTGGDSVETQTRQVLDKIDALLAEAGTDRSRMLQAVIWLSDMSHFAAMNAVWDAWVPEGAAPARACGEARLARPDLDVEIIVTAALPG